MCTLTCTHTQGHALAHARDYGEKKLRDHLVIKPDSLQRWHAIKTQLTKIFLTGAFNQQFFPLEITKWLKRLQLGHNGGIDGYFGHSIQDVTTWHKTWQSVPCRGICAVLTKTICMPYEAFIKVTVFLNWNQSFYTWRKTTAKSHCHKW